MRRSSGVAGWVALLAGLAAPGLARAQAGGLRMGLTVRPETVSVGRPFTLTVRVEAPAGATITFPPAPDSGGPIEALDPMREADAGGSAGRADRTATYRLVAWNVGSLPLTLGDVLVRPVGGAATRLSLGDTRVFVASVLPADTTLRVPREAKWILETPAPWWWPWLPMVLGAVALAALVWWSWRRRRRGRAPADPVADAERAFARVESLGLLEAGERGRFVALTVEVLREFLARRLPSASTALTSGEAVTAVQAHDGAAAAAPRLADLLASADLVKFARRPVSTEQARELGREARGLVRDVDAGIRASEAAARAAARPRDARPRRAA